MPNYLLKKLIIIFIQVKKIPKFITMNNSTKTALFGAKMSQTKFNEKFVNKLNPQFKNSEAFKKTQQLLNYKPF